MKAEGRFTDIDKEWLGYQHPDVFKHFPPQLVIGK
jgi:hypothetical protein